MVWDVSTTQDLRSVRADILRSAFSPLLLLNHNQVLEYDTEAGSFLWFVFPTL